MIPKLTRATEGVPEWPPNSQQAVLLRAGVWQSPTLILAGPHVFLEAPRCRDHNQQQPAALGSSWLSLLPGQGLSGVHVLGGSEQGTGKLVPHGLRLIKAKDQEGFCTDTLAPEEGLLMNLSSLWGEDKNFIVIIRKNVLLTSGTLALGQEDRADRGAQNGAQEKAHQIISQGHAGGGGTPGR